MRPASHHITAGATRSCSSTTVVPVPPVSRKMRSTVWSIIFMPCPSVPAVVYPFSSVARGRCATSIPSHGPAPRPGGSRRARRRPALPAARMDHGVHRRLADRRDQVIPALLREALRHARPLRPLSQSADAAASDSRMERPLGGAARAGLQAGGTGSSLPSVTLASTSRRNARCRSAAAATSRSSRSRSASSRRRSLISRR